MGCLLFIFVVLLIVLMGWFWPVLVALGWTVLGILGFIIAISMMRAVGKVLAAIWMATGGRLFYAACSVLASSLGEAGAEFVVGLAFALFPLLILYLVEAGWFQAAFW